MKQQYKNEIHITMPLVYIKIHAHAVQNNFLPKSTIWKGGKRVNLQWRHLTDPPLHEEFKVSINSDKSCC